MSGAVMCARRSRTPIEIGTASSGGGRARARTPDVRFAPLDFENAESLGTVAFARRDFNPGDVIPQGKGRSLRIVNVIEPERDDQLPVLVVEVAGK
jgi:hypothetical protein